MNPDLQSAARKALIDYEVVVDSGTNSSFAITAEIENLERLRAADRYDLLAARCVLLITLGWRRTDLAERLGISRVTLSKWINENTFGSDTFDSIAPDKLSFPIREDMWKFVYSLLSHQQTTELSQIRFAHDKFIVPPGFVKPLQTLWRIAYRSRGAASGADPSVANAGNALDILISLLLRRGVTNLAIAHAAGVTHRAVIDRMNRARARKLVLDCGAADGSCEAFYGEDFLKSLAVPGSAEMVPAGEWLNRDDLGASYTPVRVSSDRPSRYWLQTAVEFDSVEPKAVLVTPASAGYAEQKFRLGLIGEIPDTTVLHGIGEVLVALRLGRMNEKSALAESLTNTYRSDPMTGVRTMWIPSDLLYTEASLNAGFLPMTPSGAARYIPVSLWTRYFTPYPLLKVCFTDPDSLAKDFPETTKHSAESKTRREAVSV